MVNQAQTYVSPFLKQKILIGKKKTYHSSGNKIIFFMNEKMENKCDMIERRGKKEIQKIMQK